MPTGEINRIPVEGSSRIASWGYDDDSQIMEIEFQSGGVYQYHNIPVALWADAQQAPSAGKWFDAHVKGVYAYERIE